MNTLDEICLKKRDHIAAQKSRVSLVDLKNRIADTEKPRGFLKALKQKQAPALIAEVKKASPSKGIIRRDFDPVTIAKIYAESGASCLSVLTDIPYFQGHDDYLVVIKQAVTLPILRKDFMLEPYQIYESCALGADCILLIMAALGDEMARDLYACAVDLEMDVLVEVHDRSELDRCLALKPMMIGVNNRNLKTLAVDIKTSSDLAAHIPDHTYKISESGITEHATVQSLMKDGYQSFLVGESLMCMPDIGAATRALLGQGNLKE